ncbi:GNAT family N-acetyltransferase [Pelosinus baikalensis]|uniref:GNAT family N-acetyltransferase n=1 Tax=Pelosinus baikalensis TaxID=2892015 RepID=A0ABS8HLG5_9FIRM|nr:GNAT family N-acetyltransferase [Pelosinus baikalensis]MCC5464010.1 GNAT family N-acetyltransferase [Pelosinus baikalensis]
MKILKARQDNILVERNEWKGRNYKMKIRTAQVGDEQSIAGVIIDTWKVAYRGIVPDSFLDSLTTEKHEELFRKNIANKTETIFVLENHKNQIVGVVSGGQDRSGIYGCELVVIYILPDYQKMGYGKRLFQELIEEHKRNQYKSMIIWTFRDNRDRKFYEILGGLAREEKKHSFDGKDIVLVGYTWQDINEIKFS